MAEIKDSSWQTQFSTLRERVEYAFTNSLFCDIEFTVDDSNGDKVALSANKFVLSVSSPVFETMFQGKLAEQGPQIHLPDCTKDGLQEMLRFLHSDVVYLAGSNVMEVLYLADKYMLPLLQDKCYEYLAKHLTPDDAFTGLIQAQQLNNTRAEELCWNVVDFQTHQAVTSKAFLNISRDLLRQVLARETLHTNEIILFRAVNAWASNRIAEENKKENGDAKRSVLSDEIVHLIRFPLLTRTEFADEVIVGGILHESEVIEVLRIFTSTAPSQLLFKGVNRSGQWNEMWTVNRFDAVDTKYCGGQQNHAIVFEVNKPIFLAGIRLFAVQSESGTVLESKLSVQNVQSKSKLFQTDVSSNVKHTIDGLYSGHSVTISPPILLLSKEKYSITYSANVQPRSQVLNPSLWNVTPTQPSTQVNSITGVGFESPYAFSSSVPTGSLQKVDAAKGTDSSFLFGSSVSRPRRSKVQAAKETDSLFSRFDSSVFTVSLPKVQATKETDSPKTESNFTSYLGSGGKSVVHCDDIKITFMNSEESNPGTTVEYGQFPSLLLKRRIQLKK